LSATQSRALPSLLEREKELAAVADGIGAAGEGTGSVLLFEGPAGIGKSELLSAARAQAAGRGLDVLSARGGELERGFGFGVVRQLFERRVAGASAGERRKLLDGAASLSGPALGLEDVQVTPAASPLTTGDPAASTNHGLYWLLVNLCERRPVLLSVDDLHWADAASVRWLIYVARRVEELPVLVAGAIRAGEPAIDPALLANLSDQRSVQVIKPRALSEAAATALIRSRLGKDADPEFSAASHHVTGGNPLLLAELVDAVRDDSIPPTRDSVATIEALAPETISRSILLRLARLAPGAEPLARAVAVLGSEAKLRHAAALADLDHDTAARAADDLAEASILAPGRPLRFAHPLLRAAVYEQIPQTERALAHSRAAHLLSAEGGGAETVAAQAIHAEPAGDPEIAAMLDRAAQDAVAGGAPDTAIAYLRRALIEPPPAALRPGMLRNLILAGITAGDWSACDGISEDPVAELAGDDAGLVASIPVLAPWHFAVARFDEGTVLVERAIEAALRIGDQSAAVQSQLQLLSVVQIDPEEALERLDRHAAGLDPGSIDQRLWLASRAWWQHFRGGPAREAAGFARQAAAGGALLAEFSASPTFGQALLVLLRADELDEAEPLIDVILDSARQRGSGQLFAVGVGLRAQLALRRGEVTGAAEDARRSLEVIREQGIAIGLPLATAWLVDPLLEQGKLAEADEELRVSGLDGPVMNHYWFTPVRFSRGRLRIAQGRIEEGIEDLRANLRRHGRTYPASTPVASEIALALARLDRDPDEVARLVDWELETAREWGTPRGIGVALRAKGLIEGREAGIELLRKAAATLASSPARHEHSRALADLGAALRRENHRAEAREVLKEALDLAHRCGAAAIAERARSELSATGARPRRETLTGIDSLTPSELRVARMAAEGMGNKEIAQALFVTVKTVETHLGHVYPKLGISSRKELPTALAADAGR
jgi:DNA-binding CsgD family transcriptional regulator